MLQTVDATVTTMEFSEEITAASSFLSYYYVADAVTDAAAWAAVDAAMTAVFSLSLYSYSAAALAVEDVDATATTAVEISDAAANNSKPFMVCAFYGTGPKAKSLIHQKEHIINKTIS